MTAYISSAFNWVKETRLVTGISWAGNAALNSRPVTYGYSAYQAFSLYHLWESALSHLLVVDTCRHGTGPISYLKISILGGDPSKGGKGGEIQGRKKGGDYVPPDTQKNCENVFHVYRDTRKFDAKTNAGIRCWPRKFARYGAISDLCPTNAPRLIFGICYLFANPVGLLTPTLKFHFEPHPKLDRKGDYGTEAEGWSYDMSFNGADGRPVALQSKNRIYPWRLGMIGSVVSGANFRLPKRIARQPSRFLLGGIQAALALGLTMGRLGRPFPIGFPEIVQKAWSYRILRIPTEQAIFGSAW